MLLRSIVVACAILPAGALAAEPVVQINVATVRVLQWTRLDDTPSLERLREAKPEHYKRAVEILRIASEESCETALKVVPVRYDAKEMRCSPGLLLTSYPAKREVFFRLDDDAYAAHVVVAPKEKLVPAKPGKVRPLER